MKTYKLEKEYQGDVTRWFKERGAFIYKMPDVGLGFKPFDCFAVYGGDAYYIEAKLEKTAKKQYNLNRIEDHQISSLLLCKKNKPDAKCEVWLWWNDKGEFHIGIDDLVEHIKTKGTSMRLEDMQKFKNEINTL